MPLKVCNDTKSKVFCNIFILQFRINVISLQSVIRMCFDSFHAIWIVFLNIQRSDELFLKRFGTHEELKNREMFNANKLTQKI